MEYKEKGLDLLFRVIEDLVNDGTLGRKQQDEILTLLSKNNTISDKNSHVAKKERLNRNDYSTENKQHKPTKIKAIDYGDKCPACLKSNKRSVNFEIRDLSGCKQILPLLACECGTLYLTKKLQKKCPLDLNLLDLDRIDMRKLTETEDAMCSDSKADFKELPILIKDNSGFRPRKLNKCDVGYTFEGRKPRRCIECNKELSVKVFHYESSKKQGRKKCHTSIYFCNDCQQYYLKEDLYNQDSLIVQLIEERLNHEPLKKFPADSLWDKKETTREIPYYSSKKTDMKKPSLDTPARTELSKEVLCPPESKANSTLPKKKILPDEKEEIISAITKDNIKDLKNYKLIACYNEINKKYATTFTVLSDDNTSIIVPIIYKRKFPEAFIDAKMYYRHREALWNKFHNNKKDSLQPSLQHGDDSWGVYKAVPLGYEAYGKVSTKCIVEKCDENLISLTINFNDETKPDPLLKNHDSKLFFCPKCKNLYMPGHVDERVFTVLADKIKSMDIEVLTKVKAIDVIQGEVELQYEHDNNIGLKDFVVRKNTFKCNHRHHKIENIDAVITVINKFGSLVKKTIEAGYCCHCNVFFILESTYQKIKKTGILACRVYDEETYYGKHNNTNKMNLAQESILMQYGYSVAKNNRLSTLTRRRILTMLLDNDILTKTAIIGYLDFFISQRQYQEMYEEAISKWEDDRKYVTEYKMENTKQYGVRSITRRHYN